MMMSQAPLVAQPAAPTLPGAAPNPHLAPASCNECHKPDAEPAGILPAEADAVCLRCHDGIRAKAERHPVGRRFDGVETVVPEGFPVPDNRLVCLTCHDVLPGCHGGHDRVANPYLLRGPSKTADLAFCTACHVPAAYERLNPHRMTDDAGGAAETTCRNCHSADMPVERADRTGTPRLIAPEPALCLGCHPLHADYFEPGHLGTVMNEAAARPADQAYLYRRAPEAAPLLPLAEDGVINCSTCHNPHEQGVFPADSVLAAGGMEPSAVRRTFALRLPGSELCLACHRP